ncbi:hypothetical protein DXG01_003041 [Tephrocybe rancida]|nr:hypothetical protein DXG01_003041 [Tephrocybe rancida]
MAANTYLAIAMAIAFETLEAGIAYDTLNASRGILVSTVVTFSYWIFGSLVVDVVLASILVICLWKSKTGLKELDQVVIHIIKITLESAALPSVCMIIAVGLYHASPHLQDHLILFFVLLTGKLYAIGMFCTLNSRIKLRQEINTNALGRICLEEWQWETAKKPGSFSTTDGELPGPSEPPRALDTTPTGNVYSSVTCVTPLTRPRHSPPENVHHREPERIVTEMRTA